MEHLFWCSIEASLLPRMRGSFKGFVCGKNMYCRILHLKSGFDLKLLDAQWNLLSHYLWEINYEEDGIAGSRTLTFKSFGLNSLLVLSFLFFKLYVVENMSICRQHIHSSQAPIGLSNCMKLSQADSFLRVWQYRLAKVYKYFACVCGTTRPLRQWHRNNIAHRWRWQAGSISQHFSLKQQHESKGRKPMNRFSVLESRLEIFLFSFYLFICVVCAEARTSWLLFNYTLSMAQCVLRAACGPGNQNRLLSSLVETERIQLLRRRTQISTK